MCKSRLVGLCVLFGIDIQYCHTDSKYLLIFVPGFIVHCIFALISCLGLGYFVIIIFQLNLQLSGS